MCCFAALTILRGIFGCARIELGATWKMGRIEMWRDYFVGQTYR